MGKGREEWPSHCRGCDAELGALEGDYCDPCYRVLPARDQRADDALLGFLWWVEDVAVAGSEVIVEPA